MKPYIVSLLAAFFVIFPTAFTFGIYATPGVAYASDVIAPVDPIQGTIDIITPVYEAVKNGNYGLAASLGIIAIVFCLRRFGASAWPWLTSNAAGALLALFVSGAGVTAAAFAAGDTFTWRLMLKALTIGLAAGGGWDVWKRLLSPLLVRVIALIKGDKQPPAPPTAPAPTLLTPPAVA